MQRSFYRVLPRVLRSVLRRSLRRSLRSHCVVGLLWLSLSATSQATEHNILVLGDSISAAYGMSLEQGWVALLTTQLKDEYPQQQHTVVNASISGETTAGGLRRLPPLLLEHQPTIVIIELGANDGLRGYPLGTLCSNLATLVRTSQEAGARVILLPMEIPPNYGARYTAGFRQCFVQVARETGSTTSPFLLDSVATDPTLMQGDGIHPTVEAQPKLLHNVLPTVIGVMAQ